MMSIRAKILIFAFIPFLLFFGSQGQILYRSYQDYRVLRLMKANLDEFAEGNTLASSVSIEATLSMAIGSGAGGYGHDLQLARTKTDSLLGKIGAGDPRKVPPELIALRAALEKFRSALDRPSLEFYSSLIEATSNLLAKAARQPTTRGVGKVLSGFVFFKLGQATLDRAIASIYGARCLPAEQASWVDTAQVVFGSPAVIFPDDRLRLTLDKALKSDPWMRSVARLKSCTRPKERLLEFRTALQAELSKIDRDSIQEIHAQSTVLLSDAKRAFNRYAAALSAAALLYLFLMYWFAVRLSYPLAQAAIFAREIGLGQWERRLPVQGKDEIANLSRSLNEAAGHLNGLCEAVHAEEERFRIVADYTYEWEYWLSETGAINWMSPACERTTGYSVRDFSDQPKLIRSIVHPDDAALFDQHIKLATDNPKMPCSELLYRIIDRNGETHWIEHHCEPVTNKDGKNLGRRATNRDITDEVRRRHDQDILEAQLQHADKLASIGTLAAGVAHEINNPLTIIAGNVRFLRSKLDALAPETSATVTKVEKSIERITTIVRGLKSFANPDDDTVDLVDVHQAVSDSMALMEQMLGASGIKLSVHLDGPPPLIRGNFGKLQQVIVNLVSNSKDALEAIPNAFIDITVDSDGEHVVLAVKDNGSGIAPESLPRIFDPFYTTKPPGKGTGLGLSISHSIIKNMKGDIFAESDSKGTRFEISLPRAARARPPG